MKLSAYAKINLYLSVLDKRPDGYHNIESVMQSVSLADTVSLELTDSASAITLTMTDPSLPCDRRNIAYRAAELFFDRHICGHGVRIHIEKNIPVAGGLAGGSTDGAAVLTGLNELCGSPFTKSELCRMGALLGADIPFCICGGAAVTLGIGDIITPAPPLPRDTRILIVRPHESVSTADAYRRIDMLGARDIPPLRAMTDALTRGSLSGIAAAAYNVFELVMDQDSEIHGIKRLLKSGGARLSMMSGSGATVFALFDDPDAAAASVGKLADVGYGSVLASPQEQTADRLPETLT